MSNRKLYPCIFTLLRMCKKKRIVISKKWMLKSFSYENTGIRMQTLQASSQENKQNTNQKEQKKKKEERKIHCNRWMKHSVIKHHVVFEVVNVVRQNLFLHCTYN